MGKLATLEFFEGSFEQGFSVTLRIGNFHAPTTTKVMGALPPVPELSQDYEHWRSLYTRLIATTGMAGRPVCLPKHTQAAPTFQQCQQAAQQVRDRLNQWLKAESFRPIWQAWLANLRQTDEVCVLLQTQTELLQKLPWHQWDLILQYPYVELALSAVEYDAVPQSLTPAPAVNILAILGHSEGIDVQSDRQTLQAMAGASVQFLPEPTLGDLTDELWQQPWRMLFFAGHSTSQADTGGGKIAVNSDESLSIGQLKYALRAAVQRGLQLAIFNSCDGLGIAQALAELQIPYLILMREPVPDAVAQAFLKYFLHAFSSGLSLHQSVRQARERLQGLENQYPCASWLPILYQNPNAIPPTWQEFIATSQAGKSRVYPLLRAVSISAIVTTSLILMRQFGWLQPLELKAFDALMRLRPTEPTDSRLLIIGITDDDLSWDEQATANLPTQQRGRGSVSDVTLARLLKKLSSAKPKLIGLDIYRDFSVRQQPQFIQQLQNIPNLIAICRGNDTPSGIPGVKPPPGISSDHLGFADFVVDPDQRIRRHLLVMEPEPAAVCTTPYAFSLQLAAHYLATTGEKWSFTPTGNLQLGTQEFPNIQSHTGGYAGIDAGGNQVLLNYRQSPNPFDQVTLQQVLNESLSSDILQDRLILIGYIGKGINDASLTPYGNMSGVLIHAHMTSQIVSAIKDRRSLLWSWSQPWEMVWIAGWSLVTALLVGIEPKSMQRSLSRGVLIVVFLSSAVSIICYCILIQGGWIIWIPPLLAIATTALLAYRSF